MGDQGEVTRLLVAWREGEREALDKLFPMVYEELRRVAHRRLQGERRGHTLNTTALVHEVYVKLVDLNRMQWQDRAHFFAIAARAMRHILINYAEKRKAAKRGGGRSPLSLEDGVILITPEQASDVLALHEALKQLETVNARYGRVVECRFFVGMSIQETAEALHLSPATVKRDWTMARAWLVRALKE